MPLISQDYVCLSVTASSVRYGEQTAVLERLPDHGSWLALSGPDARNLFEPGKTYRLTVRAQE